MTSITSRAQRRLADRPVLPSDAEAARPARRILLVASVLSTAVLVLALIGCLIDPRTIGGAPAWVKPAKFGLSITLTLLTLRWMLLAVDRRRRLLTAVSVVLATAFGLEMLWIVVQVARGTTSHFNTATAFDAATYNGAGFVVSMIFLATLVVAVLALRTRGLDAGITAGIRWGLGVSLLGMLEAVSMLLNGVTATTNGAHTVGAPDGGPGLPLTDWSLAHGDLRIGHFLGLHALQALPVLAWLLLRCTRLDQWTRRDLVRVGGAGWAGLVVLVWWQAERGQALLRPDGLTLGAAAAPVLAGLLAGAAVLLRARLLAMRAASDEGVDRSVVRVGDAAARAYPAAMARRSIRQRLFGLSRGLDRNLLPFMGPAQVGAGHPEEPYRLPDDPRCPICGGPMDLHAVDRSTDPSRSTRFRCPPREAWADRDAGSASA